MSSETQREWIETILVEPLEDVLFSLAKGISQAQRRLDENSMATQILIDNEEELSKYGFEAPWYRFPETHLELRMALSMQGEKEERQVEGKKVQYSRLRMGAAPLNASYIRTFNYNVTGASTVRTKIVLIPAQVKKVPEGG